MQRRNDRRPPKPLDRERLNELALAYVGRFATTRAKLATYLNRKIRERGWAGAEGPAVEAIVERLAGLGYVDDAAFALSKSRSLIARGYGPRRVGEALRAAGIDDPDRSQAEELARSEAVDSAIRFASRRRFGPFAPERFDRARQEKMLAAMVRAGHSFALSSAILAIEPGNEVDVEILAEKV